MDMRNWYLIMCESPKGTLYWGKAEDSKSHREGKYIYNCNLSLAFSFVILFHIVYPCSFFFSCTYFIRLLPWLSCCPASTLSFSLSMWTIPFLFLLDPPLHHLSVSLLSSADWALDVFITVCASSVWQREHLRWGIASIYEIVGCFVDWSTEVMVAVDAEAKVFRVFIVYQSTNCRTRHGLFKYSIASSLLPAWIVIAYYPLADCLCWMCQIMIHRVTRREAFGKYLAEQVCKEMGIWVPTYFLQHLWVHLFFHYFWYEMLTSFIVTDRYHNALLLLIILYFWIPWFLSLTPDLFGF